MSELIKTSELASKFPELTKIGTKVYFTMKGYAGAKHWNIAVYQKAVRRLIRSGYSRNISDLLDIDNIDGYELMLPEHIVKVWKIHGSAEIIPNETLFNDLLTRSK